MPMTSREAHQLLMGIGFSPEKSRILWKVFAHLDEGQLEMRVTDTHIRWRANADDEWHDLIALDELEGPPGPEGEASTVPGPPGADGTVWFVGSGDPTVPTKEGDLYLNQGNGDVWRFS